MRVPLEVAEKSLTVPYGPIDHGDSVNYGFVDLKAFPELIPEIPEVKDCPELVTLLEALNSPKTVFRSLGCEKSFSEYANPEHPHLTTKLVAYVDVAFHDPALNADPVNFEEMIGAYASFAQRCQFARFVMFEAELTKTCYALLRVDGWCVTIWAGGFGENEADARTAWRTVIEALTQFFASGWAPGT